jgi:hypothetical protein
LNTPKLATKGAIGARRPTSQPETVTNAVTLGTVIETKVAAIRLSWRVATGPLDGAGQQKRAESRKPDNLSIPLR